jgi:glycosyltransferase involved in cell wall biosynthesis
MLLENVAYERDARVPYEAEALVSAGHRVSVICPREPNQPWRQLRKGVQVYCFPQPPQGDGLLGYVLEYGYAMAAAFVLSLLVLWREGFDVVHAHCPPDTFVFIAAFYKLLGKLFVYDHHDLSPELYSARSETEGSRLVYRALLGLERLCCALADHVITTNESYKRVEMQRGRVPGQRITVVRNGPDLKRLRPVIADPILRRDGHMIISYVGWMGLQDGVDYLLRALRHLVHDLGRSDFLCVLVGTGEACARLRQMAEPLGLAGHVLFAGWVAPQEVARYLSAADVCVAPEPSNPYNDRSTVVKMMEYMALGKPIVAFDLPEHRVTAQGAALYARPNDELDFARQIVTLMDDPQLRDAMGQAGRERVEKELAWPHQARLLVGAYGTLR